MSEKCFYCENNLDEVKSHTITFFHDREEREEELCPDCYSEWLQGIKE